MPLLQTFRHTLRLLTTATLCLVQAGQPLCAATRAAAGPPPTATNALHALNRFTFGPRPGDVAAVQALGLNKWFEQQLNPDRIDDSALDARLANYPAMKLSQEALMERFPSPAVIRTMEKQGLPLPSDPAAHAIYADQLAFYKMKLASDAKGKKAAGPADSKTDEDVMMAPPPAGPEARLYSGLDAVNIINLPPDARMQRLLSMTPADLLAFRRSLNRQELADAAEGLSPEQKETLAALSGSGKVVGGELLQTRLLRDVYSNRQLEAVMTDFWLNHFNVFLRKNQNEPYLLPAFERDVIRPHALGSFEDLLVAVARSPAMLMYLDNWQSIGPDSKAARRNAGRALRNPDAPLAAKAKPASGLNENYARELMELHTLGVDGGYTQADVTEVAKVFTGWTIEQPYRGAAYHFEENRHEPGTKQLLGTTIHEGGEREGLDVLHQLASSPATAHFLATKLAIRFVSDTPPPALVDRMANTFLTTHGDLKAVLRTLFNAPEFWSPGVYRAKVKTPLEFVVSAARASGTDITNPQPLVQALTTLGMPLYGMQTPNGYSWLAEPWISTSALVSRMNFALLLTGDKLPGIRTSLPTLVADAGTATPTLRPVTINSPSPDAAAAVKEQRLEQILLGQPAGDRTRATVLQQFADSAAQQQAERDFPIKPTTPEQLDDMLPGGRVSAPPIPQATRPPTAEDRQIAAMAGLLLGSPEFQRR